MIVSGSMKMKSGEWIQLFVLMLVFCLEVMCMEVILDEVLLIDCMNKCYVWVICDELKGILFENVDFDWLEKFLFKVLFLGEKKEFIGCELGILFLEKVKVRLFDFLIVEFELIFIEVLFRYI